MLAAVVAPVFLALVPGKKLPEMRMPFFRSASEGGKDHAASSGLEKKNEGLLELKREKPIVATGSNFALAWRALACSGWKEPASLVLFGWLLFFLFFAARPRL